MSGLLVAFDQLGQNLAEAAQRLADVEQERDQLKEQIQALTEHLAAVSPAAEPPCLNVR